MVFFLEFHLSGFHSCSSSFFQLRAFQLFSASFCVFFRAFTFLVLRRFIVFVFWPCSLSDSKSFILSVVRHFTSSVVQSFRFLSLWSVCVIVVSPICVFALPIFSILYFISFRFFVFMCCSLCVFLPLRYFCLSVSSPIRLSVFFHCFCSVFLPLSLQVSLSPGVSVSRISVSLSPSRGHFGVKVLRYGATLCTTRVAGLRPHPPSPRRCLGMARSGL